MTLTPVTQADLFSNRTSRNTAPPFHLQLLKWIGNKQRFAHEIIAYFPAEYRRYHEPFLGSGAVLGTLAPKDALASDTLPPLIGIWQMLATHPDRLLKSYERRWQAFQRAPRKTYEWIKARFNKKPNPMDLLFLSRACYGGVIRFRRDGFMSTPLGVHAPIAPAAMAKRIERWCERTKHATFRCCDFEATIAEAQAGDVVYCDPPYHHTQSILYGAQDFSLERLLKVIGEAKQRGVRVALSLDGSKKSGELICHLPIPPGLFERTVFVNCGGSMLKRFQVAGADVSSDVVADRLLLTWA